MLLMKPIAKHTDVSSGTSVMVYYHCHYLSIVLFFLVCFLDYLFVVFRMAWWSSAEKRLSLLSACIGGITLPVSAIEYRSDQKSFLKCNAILF